MPVMSEPLVMELDPAPQYQPLLRGRPQTRGMRSGRVVLQPGETCGCHTTGDHEEMLVFLAGRGQAHIDDRPAFNVGAGKISYIPPHTHHNIVNNGSETLIYIYCVAPTTNTDNPQ